MRLHYAEISTFKSSMHTIMWIDYKSNQIFSIQQVMKVAASHLSKQPGFCFKYTEIQFLNLSIIYLLFVLQTLELKQINAVNII